MLVTARLQAFLPHWGSRPSFVAARRWDTRKSFLGSAQWGPGARGRAPGQGVRGFLKTCWPPLYTLGQNWRYFGYFVSWSVASINEIKMEKTCPPSSSMRVRDSGISISDYNSETILCLSFQMQNLIFCFVFTQQMATFTLQLFHFIFRWSVTLNTEIFSNVQRMNRGFVHGKVWSNNVSWPLFWKSGVIWPPWACASAVGVLCCVVSRSLYRSLMQLALLYCLVATDAYTRLFCEFSGEPAILNNFLFMKKHKPNFLLWKLVQLQLRMLRWLAAENDYFKFFKVQRLHFLGVVDRACPDRDQITVSTLWSQSIKQHTNHDHLHCTVSLRSVGSLPMVHWRTVNRCWCSGHGPNPWCRPVPVFRKSLHCCMLGY